MAEGNGSLPLDGIRVLDVTHVIAGPFCAAVLGDYGAEVIKVEPPGRGERSRRIVPQIERNGQTMSGLFATLNRNRKGVTLDLKSESGLKAFKELAAACDVLLENFSPGTMDRLGLGYAALREINPGLVYVSISGYGQLEPYVGPYTNWGANNAAVQAMSGIMEVSGDEEGPPAVLGATLGDTIPGLWAVISTLLALEHRKKTGEGQFVDVSMYDCLVSMCFKSVTDYHITGVPPSRGREEGWYTTFTTRLKCRDGYIAVSFWGGAKEQWERFWRGIGRDDMLSHPDFSYVHPGRPGSFEVVKEAAELWLSGIGKWDAVQRLLGFGFTAGVVQNAEDVYHCPHLKARELFMEMEDGIGGAIRTVGSPVKFSRLEAKETAPPHLLGQHTVSVLTDILGYSVEEAQAIQQGDVPT